MMMPQPVQPPVLIQQLPGSSGTQPPAGAYPPGMELHGRPANVQQRLQAMATGPRDSQPQGRAHWHQLHPLGPGGQVPQELPQQQPGLGGQAPAVQHPGAVQQHVLHPVVMQPGMVQQRPQQPVVGQPVDPQQAQHQRTRAGQSRAEHMPPPPPPMMPAAASSSSGSRGGTLNEPTPEEAKQLQAREREKRAAARAAMQGQARAEDLSNMQRDAIAAYMQSDHYKGLGAGMTPEMQAAPTIDLFSDPEEEEEDEDYRPASSGSKKRR